MNFFLDLRSILVVLLGNLVLIDWVLVCNDNRCWNVRWKVDLDTWFNSDQTLFRIRSAQGDVSGVNEILPLLSCPFRLGVNAHVIIN